MSEINDSNTPVLDPITALRHSIFFAVLTPSFILSVLCYLYIFIQFCQKPHLYRNVHSHLVLIVLIVSFLQVISEQLLTLIYLHNSVSVIQSDKFCKFWSAQDFVLGGIILMLMSFGSIERYLLIFHRAFMFRHLILLHYLPIIICIVYPFLYYVGMIYIYPCVNYFDYTVNVCGGPCYVYDPLPSTFDLIFNLAVFETIGVLSNIVLVSRVLHKKYRMKQQQMWKKNRRLLIQVLSITVLHNIMLFFMVIFMLIELFSPVPQPTLIDITFNVLQYGVYLVHLLCPFVSLIGLPELWPHTTLRFCKVLLTNNTVKPTINILPVTNDRRNPEPLTRANESNEMKLKVFNYGSNIKT